MTVSGKKTRYQLMNYSFLGRVIPQKLLFLGVWCYYNKQGYLFWGGLVNYLVLRYLQHFITLIFSYMYPVLGAITPVECVYASTSNGSGALFCCSGQLCADFSQNEQLG